MEHSRPFLKKFKKIRFQVWNLAKFQTWNRTFLNFFKKSLKCSKKSQIYLLWTSSEPILSKIRAPFFSKKKASVVVWIWKKIPKIPEFFNLKSDFFEFFQKKRQKTRKFRTFIYREPHVSQFWAKSEKLFSGRSVGSYHSLRSRLFR